MHVAGIMAGLAGVSGDQTSGLTGVYPYGSKGFLYGYSPQEDPRTKPENNPDDWHGYCSNMAYLMSVATLVVQNVKVINISRGLNWNCDPKDDPDGFNRITERLKNQGILDPPETQPEAMLKMFDDYDNFTPWVDQAQKVGAFYQRLLDAGYDFLLVVSAGNLGGYNGEQGDGVKKLAYPRPEPLPLESRYNSTMTMIDSNRYPDVYQRILVVGAVEPRPDMPEEDGVVPMLSGYSNAGDRVDLFAPGGQYLTPDLIRGGMKKFPAAAEGTMIYSTLLENRYGYKAGTSMAAPQASGTAALVWSVNPKLSGADVKEILKQSARRDCIYSNNVNGSDGKIGEIIHDEHYKLLDAEGAVRMAMEFKGSGTAAKQNYGAFVGQVEWKTTEKKWFKTQEKTERKEGAEIVAVVREGDDIGRTYTATTGVGGSFCLLVPPGTYSIRYGFKDGRKYKGKETNRQTIRAGETIDLNVLTVTDQDESLNIIACNMQLPGTSTAKEEYEIHTDHITEFMKAVGIYVPPKAWMRYYDHIYAIYDYPASGNTKWWGVLWRRNPYPVSIETSGEQKAIEQLMLHGEKVSYITGGQIMFLFENPELYWAISDDDTGFTNFAEGHGIIKEPMLGNFVNLFHGTGKDDPEFGQWKVNHETIRTFLPNYYPEDTGYILEWDCEPLYSLSSLRP